MLDCPESNPTSRQSIMDCRNQHRSKLDLIGVGVVDVDQVCAEVLSIIAQMWCLVQAGPSEHEKLR
jgi:hypothetical protein